MMAGVMPLARTGVIAIIYSFIFYRGVRDTPEGSTYFKPQKAGGLEVTTKGDFVFLRVNECPIIFSIEPY
jgi:NNP family nitrate/nitrite transporter-like MFS transporter